MQGRCPVEYGPLRSRPSRWCANWPWAAQALPRLCALVTWIPLHTRRADQCGRPGVGFAHDAEPRRAGCPVLLCLLCVRRACFLVGANGEPQWTVVLSKGSAPAPPRRTPKGTSIRRSAFPDIAFGGELEADVVADATRRLALLRVASVTADCVTLAKPVQSQAGAWVDVIPEVNTDTGISNEADGPRSRRSWSLCGLVFGLAPEARSPPADLLQHSSLSLPGDGLVIGVVREKLSLFLLATLVEVAIRRATCDFLPKRKQRDDSSMFVTAFGRVPQISDHCFQVLVCSFFWSPKASSIAKGNVRACEDLLEHEGLLQYFYGESHGSVCELHGSNASFLRSLMSRQSVAVDEACFVEADAQEIESIQGICRSMFVSKRRGMTLTEIEMKELRHRAGAFASDAVETQAVVKVVAKPQAAPPSHSREGASPAKNPVSSVSRAGFSGMFKSGPLEQAARPAAAPSAQRGRLKQADFDFDWTISKIHAFKQLAGRELGVDAPQALSEHWHIHRLNASQATCQDSNGTGAPCAAGRGLVLDGMTCARGAAEQLLFEFTVKVSGAHITKGNLGLLQYFEKVVGTSGQFYGESDFDRANPEPSLLEASSHCELHESIASFLRSWMSRQSVAVDEACSVEADAQEIESIQGICRSMFVSKRRGMTLTEIEMKELRHRAGAFASDAVETQAVVKVVAKPQAAPPSHSREGASPAKNPVSSVSRAGFSGMFKSGPLEQAARPAAAPSAQRGRLKHADFDFDWTISKIHAFKQLAGRELGVDAPQALSEHWHIHRLNASQATCQDSNGTGAPCAAGRGLVLDGMTCPCPAHTSQRAMCGCCSISRRSLGHQGSSTASPTSIVPTRSHHCWRRALTASCTSPTRISLAA
ncbi:unnamed protein product [Symbiodinium sp. CCMP2592]|nr:unnamed protein product [Symbiodinium sp. CCMP2592]